MIFLLQAYKNFGSRVKTMKRKLDELVTSLPSPIPSPDINAPSPSPLDDIELPGEDNTTGNIFFQPWNFLPLSNS
jgi:hypothetical protein